MTRRTARVSVRNNTDIPLVGVSVVHKYSDNYKNEQQWGIIPVGEIPDETLEVEYNTGAFTTGRDWWVVTWFNPEMTTLYYSDPDNFRGIIDSLENLGPDVIAAVAGAIAGLGGSVTGPGAVAAAAGAAAAAKIVTTGLFNSEGTEGFKQHILREEDEDALTEIVINEDRSITFRSNSGSSDTGTSEKLVEGGDI